MYLLKRFRSFNEKNLGSVDQRAAKLLAIKVGVLKKKSATSAIPSNCMQARLAQVRFRARSNHSQSLMANNFAAL